MVLSNIQPLLNWTVVITIATANTNSDYKTIVVAGEDEKDQWDFISDRHGNNKMGVIYIQELKENDKTMPQEQLSIGSLSEMEQKLGIGNMAEWLYNHFVELPKFLTGQKPSFCKISENVCEQYQNNCINCLFKSDHFNSKDFNKREFAKEVYSCATPIK